uniref:Cytochrome c oxidase subunit 3 n=1 Tax=Centruroides vittatus TaxID=120091 RepID=A0A343UQG9_CENVT|nr:cytochrome c oxidase subunit III [Centruroides vittatus]AVF96944.1 cytochrome c oxidase subunit III [Centruroides vittatus]
MENFHPYHLVHVSPWPLTGALGGLFLVSGLVRCFYSMGGSLLFFGGLVLVLTSIQWWRDVVREGCLNGDHSLFVVNGLKVGMILFIVSEVFFFVSFFWAFFHSSLAPTLELGLVWPPFMIEGFNPFHVPLLNTSILLASGVSVTWCHHSILKGEYFQAVFSLGLTLFLGVYFSVLQGFEYYEAAFGIYDSVYGSTFFMATGFHGLHVLIGSTFLGVCLYRSLRFHFSGWHHFGFEAAAWYWHFVDVVWLFLFVSIYWWGK